MFIAKVIGSVVATVKDRNFEGCKLLIVQPVRPDGVEEGSAMLAVDIIDAGEGDKVLVNREGSSARLLFQNERIPLQAVVVGVIDEVEYQEESHHD